MCVKLEVVFGVRETFHVCSMKKNLEQERKTFLNYHKKLDYRTLISRKDGECNPAHVINASLTPQNHPWNRPPRRIWGNELRKINIQ